MSEPFIGEIRLFGGNFAPRGWAFCNGQLLPVSQNTALFSVLGTTYGGDGRTTFALPDLQGRAPMHQGQGPGLTPRTIGEKDGASSVTLQSNQMPAHTHQAMAGSGDADSQDPTNRVWAKTYQTGLGGRKQYKSAYSTTAEEAMSPQALAAQGGNAAHNNMQPYLGLSFIIALQGVYPVRS